MSKYWLECWPVLFYYFSFTGGQEQCGSSLVADVTEYAKDRKEEQMHRPVKADKTDTGGNLWPKPDRKQNSARFCLKWAQWKSDRHAATLKWLYQINPLSRVVIIRPFSWDATNTLCAFKNQTRSKQTCKNKTGQTNWSILRININYCS